MSKCISSHGEYSEHEFAKDDCVPRDRFICAWCFVFDEDAALDEIDSLRVKIARVEELARYFAAIPEHRYSAERIRDALADPEDAS